VAKFKLKCTECQEKFTIEVTKENKAKTYSLKGPDHNKSFIKTPVNPSIVTDQYIANNYFLYLQEHIGNLAQTFRSSMTNDSFRQVIHKIALKTIAEEDALVKYMKIKGWLETPPMYPNLPAAVEEKITTCEAYHLWDHLAFRYDNIHQTHLFANYAYDGDLKLMLEMGLKTLEKQCNLLEKELRQFGISLPKRPSEILPLPDNTEIFADDHMFRTLLIGLQGASIVHVAALKQATFNDRIRGIFKQLLFEEMEYIDKLIAFSKVKGWLNAPPQYRV